MIRFAQKIVAVIFRDKQIENNLSEYLMRNSIHLFLLQIISLGLGVLSNYILIKIVGVNGYGSYIYIFNLLYLLLNFCLIGADTLLVRKISVYEEAGDYRQLKGIIYFGMIAVFLGSIFFSFLSDILIHFTKFIKNNEDFNWLILSLTSLIMLSVTAINQASLQGLKKIFLSQVTEKIFRPALIIILMIAIFFFQKKVSATEAIWINVLVIGITMGFTFYLFQRNIGFRLKKIKPKFEFTAWTNAALSFSLLGILNVLNSRIDILLLGIYRGNAEVGVYNIVLKISETIGFVLVVVNFVLSPIIAKLFANGEIKQLQLLITRSARMVLLFTTPLILMIFIFGGTILTFFGVNILNGISALLILCSGQIVNILFGSVGTLLMMTGNQRFSIYSLVVGISFNIVMNIILTPKYGIIGTAIATAGSLGIWNLLMYLFVRKKLKIHTTAFKIV